MAIQGPGNIPERIRAVSRPVQAETRVQKPVAQTPAPKDEVTISPRAREVQSLARQAAATPEVRPGRVNEVKARTANVPASKVAEKLLLEN